jgi:hypothetical protein
MDYLGLTKQVVGLVVSLGVGTIVKNAIEHTTPATISTLKKVGVGIGGFVISMMVSEVATKYTEQKIDEFAVRFGDNNANV